MTRISVIPPMIILAIFVFSPTKIDAQKNPQILILYSEPNQGGRSITITASYIPDLSAVGFDNMARSACVTGVWLFYDLPYYNQWQDAPTEYATHHFRCFNFEYVAGLVSSIRFAGFPTNYRRDSLTLYAATYFQGIQEYIPYDQLNLYLDQKSSSLIITGMTPWTVYDEPNFEGNSACIHPRLSEGISGAFIEDTNIIIGLPHHPTIRSVRKGCYGQRQVYSDDQPGHGGVGGLMETNN